MSTRNFSKHIDGYFGAARRVSRTPREYPFRANGDTTTAIYSATYLVDQGLFSPTAIGTVDPETAGFYLMEETKPEIIDGDLATFRRTYSNVPGDQVRYLTLVLTKPNPETVVGVSTTTFSYKSGTYDVGISAGFAVFHQGSVFARSNKVYSRTGIATPTLTTPTGGTFTLTYNGSTTSALAYDASNGTIAAAVNGLASVIAAGLTFTASNLLTSAGTCTLTLTATVGTPAYKFTCASSITPAAASTVFVLQTSSTVQVIGVGARATLTAHGFVATNELYLEATAVPSAKAMWVGSWSVVDSATIAFAATAFPYTQCDYMGSSFRGYTPGSARVRIRDTQSFYLPGVTGGITTVNDIPVPAANTSDLAILNLAANKLLTGYQTYDATKLDLWRESKIYEQTVTAINVDNL